MYCNELKLSGVLEEFFLSIHDFWFQKCKNQIFEENKRFECSFIKFKYRWLLTCLVDLKNIKNLTFSLWQIFYEFLKINNFPNFQKFLEIISCTY